MEREKPKPITWRELKDFVNSIPEEKMQDVAFILVEDDSRAKPLLEPFFMHENIYSNKDDFEDSGMLEDLRYAHGDEFNPDDYHIVTRKGTPFLWAE